MADPNWKNKLFFGDNLDVLRKDIPDACVDLIYLDPPFNSNASYNVLFKEQKTGKQSAAQIMAFEDTWHWTLKESQVAYEEVVRSGHTKLSDLIQAMRKVLGENDMLAYLVMMAVRLIELRRVMKPAGSIYLHCDTTASHYLKLVMDALFRPENFRSEITWKRTNVHNDSKDWSDVADILLYYVKDAGGGQYTWNPIYLKHTAEHVASKYQEDAEGRMFTLSDMTSPSPRPNMMYEWKGHPHRRANLPEAADPGDGARSCDLRLLRARTLPRTQVRQDPDPHHGGSVRRQANRAPRAGHQQREAGREEDEGSAAGSVLTEPYSSHGGYGWCTPYGSWTQKAQHRL
jgi:site-specific DNA-methyltransferase (adenine-specific)